MRVSREQAAENRKRVIETASRLFRENGFDGIGLKDLMAGAGLTQGGFYKQFASKDELVAVATRRALESVSERWSKAAAARPDDSLRAVCEFYLSRGHSAERADGCPIVALGSDAARQGPEVKAAFEAGMLGHLAMVTGCSARGAKTRRWSCCRRWSARFSCRGSSTTRAWPSAFWRRRPPASRARVASARAMRLTTGRSGCSDRGPLRSAVSGRSSGFRRRFSFQDSARSHRRCRLLLAGLAAIGTLATNIILPAFPRMGAELELTGAQLGLLLSSFSLTFALGQLVVGPLSDRFGRRSLVLGGLVTFVRAVWLQPWRAAFGAGSGPRHPGLGRLCRLGARPRHRPRPFSGRGPGQGAVAHHDRRRRRTRLLAAARERSRRTVRLAHEFPVRRLLRGGARDALSAAGRRDASRRRAQRTRLAQRRRDLSLPRPRSPLHRTGFGRQHGARWLFSFFAAAQGC